MKTIFYSTSTSVAQIYGNVMQAVEMYIKSNLPPEYIRDNSISTQSSFRYFKKFINTRQEFEKKRRPFMIIRPTVENVSPSDGNEFLSGTNLVWFSGWNGGSGLSIQEFCKDPKRDLSLGFKIGRCKMTFDIAIQTNTYMEMMDIANYLNVVFSWDRPVYIPTSLESMIPYPILEHLCEIVGINIDDPNNIPVLTRYLRTHSSYPISYKMQNSTSNDQYFLFYPQNLMSRFTDLTMEEAQRKNMVEDFANVTFKIECSFNAIGTYTLYGKKNTYKTIKLCTHHDDGGSFTPIYTYERIFGDCDYIDQGYSLYSANIIKSSPERDKKSESIDIRACLPADVKKLIDEILATGGDINMLLKTRVIYNNRDASADVDFDMNWSKYELTIKETDMTFTYRFLIYINMSYYTEHTIDDIMITDQQNMNGDTHTGYHNTH